MSAVQLLRQPQKKWKLDVIVPCYNPRAKWEVRLIESIQEIRATLPECDIHFVVVDDGSDENFTDFHMRFLKDHGSPLSILRNETNHGKGHSIRAGISQCHSDYVIYTDIDFPYTAESVAKVFWSLTTGSDVVFGVRSSAYYEKLPFQRLVISKVFQVFNKYLLGLKIKDTQCGLKGMSKAGRKSLLTTQTNHYLFDMEFLAQASRDPNLRIVPEPVTPTENLVVTTMKWKVLGREISNLAKIILNLYLPGLLSKKTKFHFARKSQGSGKK